MIQPPLGRLHHSGPLEALNNSLADATAGHLLELVALSLLQIAIDESMIDKWVPT